MRDDFAVFILTHGRAKIQKTFQALRECGYSGKVYFVIDDMDDEAEEYRRLYGDDVIVFDKKEQAQKTDTFMNREELRAVVYARNFSCEKATEMGLKFFVNCDDDIRIFKYKINQNGNLITKAATNLDKIFTGICEMMDDGDLECMSITEEGAYIGGVNKMVESGRNWKLSHFYFMRGGYKVEVPKHMV